MQPPFPAASDDLLVQFLALVRDIISLQKPSSLVAYLGVVIAFEKQFSVFRRLINRLAKREAQEPPPPPKPNDNGNGNGDKHPYVLELINTKEARLLEKQQHFETRYREDKQGIRELMDTFSFRLTRVERDLGDIQRAFRDELAPMRTQLEAIDKYIKDQGNAV